MKRTSITIILLANAATLSLAAFQRGPRPKAIKPDVPIFAAPKGSPQDVAQGGAALGRLTTFAGATLPAVRSLESDGLNFASVGCKLTADDKQSEMPAYSVFMPACMKHMRQLINEVDGSYTDIQLETVLEHECGYSKRFPKSCDSGFEKDKHCRDFAHKLVSARDEELQTGSRTGFHDACQDYFVLRGGQLPRQPMKVEPKFQGEKAPMFTKKSMPPVSTTLHCIINLALQYFAVYTALAIVRTLNQFNFKLDGVQSILETGCTTVTYAPMLCVLFLGARMRAIQLSQGETEKYQLPQPWVQNAMIVASTAVCLQVVLVLLVGVSTGMGKVDTDSEGNLDVSKLENAHPTAVKLLTIARYIVMAMLYGGFTVVVLGVFMMKGPKEIWGNKQLPVSPAVMCTILLSGMFFLVYLGVAVTKTCFEVSSKMRNSPVLLKMEASFSSAKMTVNFAPMLCILFIGARMRALQIDPKNGNPQSWAQKCFFLCTFSVLVQALVVILMPFVARGVCKRGKFEGDISFKMENPTIGAVMTAVRYVCLLGLYGGIAVVVYSIYVIKHPEGRSKTPPVSPAMQCVITLTVQYFLIYIVLFALITAKTFVSGRGMEHDEEDNAVHLIDTRESPAAQAVSKAIAIFDAARSTVMFAPMLSVLFIGARMRALQLTKAKNGTIPAGAGPQKWAQDGMFLATWSVFVQLIMTMLVPIFTGKKPEMGDDGHAKVPQGTAKGLAIMVEVVRYLSLLAMYGGAVVVMYGVYTMSPDSLPPYNEDNLVPGVEIPKPPMPTESF
jgi:hypothetical protein